MKYVILIHSNPQPWGHPTPDFLPEYQSMPADERAKLHADFEALLTELHQSGELLSGQALGDPATSHLYRWKNGKPVITDGPYSESKEHLAGFFVIDVATPTRAQEIVQKFTGPGETVELRPAL